MSWQATAWAKRTTGHATSAEKLLLLILADCADPESALAWPGIEALATYMEASERTVHRSLRLLEAAGFISQVRRGNQYLGSSVYLLNLEQLESRVCTLAPANMSGAHQGRPMSTCQSAQTTGHLASVHLPSSVEHLPNSVDAPATGGSLGDQRSSVMIPSEPGSGGDGEGNSEAVIDGQREEETAAAALWRSTLAILEHEVTRPNFDIWLASTVGLRLVEDGSELAVVVNNQIALTWLSGRCQRICDRAASKAAGRATTVKFVVAGRVATPATARSARAG